MGELDAAVREASALAVRLAAEHVQTVDGAIRLWQAERRGRARQSVLHTLERRIAQLGGEVSPFMRTSLIVEGRWKFEESGRP